MLRFECVLTLRSINEDALMFACTVKFLRSVNLKHVTTVNVMITLADYFTYS